MMRRNDCESCGLVSSASTIRVRMKRRRLFLVAMWTHTRPISCSAAAGSGTRGTPRGIRPRTQARREPMNFVTGEWASASLQCAGVDDRNHIAATLRQARAQRDLSVDAAAAEAGIPARYAHLLEGETPSGVGIS